MCVRERDHTEVFHQVLTAAHITALLAGAGDATAATAGGRAGAGAGADADAAQLRMEALYSFVYGVSLVAEEQAPDAPEVRESAAHKLTHNRWPRDAGCGTAQCIVKVYVGPA